jgi:DNA ligase 1
LWSRGEELVTENFPELAAMAADLPDGLVLDGEIICYQNNQPLPFAHLQKRIGKKKPSKKLLQEYPVVFLAYDILEWQGQDLRAQPLHERREKLTALCHRFPLPQLKLSPSLAFAQWSHLETLHSQARAAQAEGLVLKHQDSVYGTGRKKGDWWKWKTAPLHIDAVLLYAQKGHGRRSNWYTDYTFAVWDGEKLVTFAKAYSGLTDAEIKEVDAFVKANAKEKFGPVRTVVPQLVFEIGFEGIAASNRHKSGVALRFPRILRWRKDKPLSEANTLADLHQLLKQYGA